MFPYYVRRTTKLGLNLPFNLRIVCVCVCVLDVGVDESWCVCSDVVLGFSVRPHFPCRLTRGQLCLCVLSALGFSCWDSELVCVQLAMIPPPSSFHLSLPLHPSEEVSLFSTLTQTVRRRRDSDGN